MEQAIKGKRKGKALFTNLLGAITGQFTRALVLGAFLPTLLFVILGWVLVVPLLPSGWSALEPLKSLGTEWIIVVVAFFTILLTGLLYNLNNSIIRLFEGYPWQGMWFGRSRIRYYKSQFDLANAQRTGLRILKQAMEQQNSDETSIDNVNQSRTHAALRVNTEFPHRKALVLPTRLGNVIRSFETYPNRQYGIDGVTFWPRLIAKVSPDYGAAVGDAKTSFDFVLNTCVLSGFMALTVLIAGLLNPSELVSWNSALQWAATIDLFALLACVFYQASINRAKVWGDMFRGAFDLYRKELLAQLGYEGKFATVANESRFWEFVSRQTLYGYPPSGKGRPLDYAIAPTSAQSSTPGANLEITRGVNVSGSNGKTEIMVRVGNRQGGGDAQGVIVTDTLAEGLQYVWDSACVKANNGEESNDVVVRGANPYDFHIGNLTQGEQKVLRYRALRIGGE